MPVGRISHWHLLCSKNTGESHLESSQCLRITLGIFSKFLRIVITHAEKASIVCDDLFQILLQERHGRLAPVNFVMTVDDPFFHQGLQSVDQGDNITVRTQCFNFSGGKSGGRSPEKRTNKCWSLKCNLPDHAVFPEPIQVLFCFHPLSSGQLKFSRADFFCQDSIFPKEIAAPEQRGRPGQRIQAKGDAG